MHDLLTFIASELVCHALVYIVRVAISWQRSSSYFVTAGRCAITQWLVCASSIPS